MPEPAEQRRHTRFDIELDGRIIDTSGKESSCVIRNFCQGGLLAQSSSSSDRHSLSFAPGEAVRVATHIVTSAGERLLRLQSRVVWVRGSYLGLSFEKPSAAIVDVLRYHQRLQTGRVSQESEITSGGEARAIEKLGKVAQQELPGLLKILTEDIGEALLAKAECASSNNECQQVFVDIKALEKLRQGDTLLQEVLASTEARQDNGLESGEDDGELSLVDTEEFEHWLEASRAQTLLNRRFGKQIGALNSRIGALSGHGNVTGMFPFEPVHFTGALRRIARDLELSSATQSVLFDRVGIVLGEKLGNFYRVLEETLDSMGAPAAQKQVLRVVQSPAEQVKADRVQPVDDGADSGASGSGDGSRQEAGPIQSIPIDRELLAHLAANQRHQREVQAQALMSHVSAMPNITESLAGWLAQLQAPMLEQAATDSGFFQNPQHPLREIVDALGHLQMFRANPDPAPKDDLLRARVSEMLRPISEGELDPETLTRVATSVRELTTQESKLYQRSVERVVEGCEGRERLRQARLKVIDEMNRRYAGRRVPSLLPQLFQAGWRTALELSALKRDEPDSAFANQLALIDVLVARLGGEAHESAPGLIAVARLKETICEQLGQFAFDPFSRNAVEKRLHKELDGEQKTPIELIEFEPLSPEPDVADDGSPPEGVGSAAWLKALAHCDAIRPGDRLRFVTEGERLNELRVAYVRPDHRLLTLVDHRGARARDLSRFELAKGLHQREIELDNADGRPLSERAVDAILAGMEERLEYQAAHDSLTGLINRQQFKVALQQALQETAPGKHAGVLVWLDIDHFRLVNEVHGNETADRLLIAVARQLEQAPGASLIGHLGGDRFAMLLPDASAPEGIRCARSIKDSISAMSFDWGGKSMTLSLSIGLVDLTGSNDHGALLKAAEQALSMAKLAGDNQPYLYREDDPEIARQRESMQWLTQVDDALESGRLQLRCQPIVPLGTGENLAPHYEILLGVRNASDQSLPIGEFIDAAERYNRMRAVDRWVTRTTMEWIAKHRAQMPALHGFAVDLSGHTASDPGFIDFVRQQFQRTGIEPAWLSFEVTETAAVSDLSLSAGIVSDLKSLGCKVALDDFGSGMASYSYLKELPVDWLKIDGVFVRGIAADRGDYGVVKSINEIGHFLGKQTIAEYVADAEILRLVTEIGVDYAQGYQIAAPTLLDDLLQLQDIA